ACDGDAQSADAVVDAARHGLAWTFHTDRVVGIVPLHGVVGEREVADIACERPEMVEACDERERASARQAAIGGLETEDAAKGGGGAGRSAGGGGEPEREQPG